MLANPETVPIGNNTLLTFFSFFLSVIISSMSPPKTAHLGGRLSRKQREKKTERENLHYRYKQIRTLAEERGKDITKLISMDLPDYRILGKLGLDKDKPVRRISINAHGAIGDMKPAFIKVPKNIVLMYVGEIGRKAIIDADTFVCNNYPPRQIALPGEKVPNVELSPSRDNQYGENDGWESGIYDCDGASPIRLGITEEFLPPFEEGEDKITYLSVVLPMISKAIGRNKWGFVKLGACLGFCNLSYSKENLDKFTAGIDTKKSGWSRQEQYADAGLIEREMDDFMHQLNYHPTNDKRLNNLIVDLFYAATGASRFFDEENINPKLRAVVPTNKENLRTMVKLTAEITKNYPQVNYKGNTATVYGELPGRAGSFMQNHVHFLQAINDGNQRAISYLWSKVFNGEENGPMVLPLCEYIYYARAGGNHALARWMQDLDLKPEGHTVDDVANLVANAKYSSVVFDVFDERYDHLDSPYWGQTGGFSLFNRPPPPMKGGFFICY